MKKFIKIFSLEVIKDNIYAKGKTLDLLIKAGDKIINIEINFVLN